MIEGSLRAGDIYQAERVPKEYHRESAAHRYFLPIYESVQSGFSGHSDNGEPCVAEIPRPRFFIGFAYQPERSASKTTVHRLQAIFSTAAL